MKAFVRNVLRTSGTDRIARLEAEVAELQDSVEENRRLNERLSDVLDVVTELLVPAVDRDDEQLRAALDSLQASRQRAK
jgi:cell shape-determining protein MreC